MEKHMEHEMETGIYRFLGIVCPIRQGLNGCGSIQRRPLKYPHARV